MVGRRGLLTSSAEADSKISVFRASKRTHLVVLNMWLLKEDVSQSLSGKGKHNQGCFCISMFSGLQEWNLGPAIYYSAGSM